MTTLDEVAVEADLYRLLAADYGVPFVRLEHAGTGPDPSATVDPDAAVLLSQIVCRHFTMLVIEVGTDAATLAICQPSDDLALQAATALTGLQIRPVVVPRGELERAIDRMFAREQSDAAAPAAPSLTDPAVVVDPAPVADPEAEVRRYLADAKARIDAFATERLAAMSGLTDRLIDYADQLQDRFDALEMARRQLYGLIGAIGEVAERLAEEAAGPDPELPQLTRAPIPPE